MTPQITVPADESGTRLDLFLTKSLPDLSRSQIQTHLKAGHILCNGEIAKPKTALKAEDLITLNIPEAPPVSHLPEDIPLKILHEDKNLIIVDKQPGMVVHPAAGNESGTLVNALLHHCKGQLASEAGESRPGIVHRLDKDTSGCLVVAKTNEALSHLSNQFAQRQTTKLYLAVAQSAPKLTSQNVFTNLGRHPVNRQKMAVVNPGSGKPAITDIHCLSRSHDGTALLLCVLHTGRTHQIRVHTSYQGHPLLGDPIYAKPSRQKPPVTRLLLHAWRLGLTHPISEEPILSEAPIPPEFHPWTDPVRDLLKRVKSLTSPEFSSISHLLA